jgi:hypothetical protein
MPSSNERIAHFKSPTKEFEFSWDPQSDSVVSYPIKDDKNKYLADYVTKLRKIKSFTFLIFGKGKRPVVIIIGWIGSSPKYLKRYIKLYNEFQFDAIWFCPPSANQYAIYTTK